MYFPKSQIKVNLYTNGGEYILQTTGEDYIGPYYEISTGIKYSGTSPNNPPNILLTPVIPASSDEPSPSNQIDKIFKVSYLDPNISSKPRILPFSSILNPTSQNYQENQFTRYFTKKTNELKYKEISEDTYKKLKNRDEQIAWDLYEPEKIEWEISGNKQIIARNNKQKVIKIEQNRRWYGFSKFLKEDYTKYWKL